MEQQDFIKDLKELSELSKQRDDYWWMVLEGKI